MPMETKEDIEYSEDKVKIDSNPEEDDWEVYQNRKYSENGCFGPFSRYVITVFGPVLLQNFSSLKSNH